VRRRAAPDPAQPGPDADPVWASPPGGPRGLPGALRPIPAPGGGVRRRAGPGRRAALGRQHRQLLGLRGHRRRGAGPDRLADGARRPGGRAAGPVPLRDRHPRRLAAARRGLAAPAGAGRVAARRPGRRRRLGGHPDAFRLGRRPRRPDLVLLVGRAERGRGLAADPGDAGPVAGVRRRLRLRSDALARQHRPVPRL
ncbi:MAG: hypothetical protein AVDCRST_MAG73-3285, partial [uncultured Thermomicrobiales bacterium]